MPLLWLKTIALRRSRRIKRETILTLGPALIVAAIGGMISWDYQANLRNDRALVAHTWEVISAGNELLQAATDAETGERGFIITGIPAFLEPYASALVKLPGLITHLRALLADNPAQLQRLDRVQEALANEMRELASGIEARQQGGFLAARETVANLVGKPTMDAVRSIVAEIDQAEHALIGVRLSRVQSRERWVAGVALAAAILSILTRGALSIWLKHPPDAPR